MSSSLANRLRGIERIVTSLFDRVEQAIANLGLVGLAIMMVVITGNAVARYLFDSPITGTYEIVELYLMPMAIFLTAAYLQRNGGNINVDIVYDRLPDDVQLFIDLIGRVAALVIFTVIAFSAGTEFWSGYVQGLRSVGVISFPIYLSWLVMALGLFALAIRLVFQIVSNLAGAYRIVARYLSERAVPWR